MQDIGPACIIVASRLAIVLQDSPVLPSLDTMRNVSRAIQEVTATCIACVYRIR